MTTRLDDAYRIHVVRHEGKDCLVVGWLCELSKDEADNARKGPAEAERVFSALLEQAHAERPVRAATSDSGIDKEEYQTLRKEVETAMSELNTLETAGLVAVAGIFAWLFANAGKLPDSAAWYIRISGDVLLAGADDWPSPWPARQLHPALGNPLSAAAGSGMGTFSGGATLEGRDHAAQRQGHVDRPVLDHPPGSDAVRCGPGCELCSGRRRWSAGSCTATRPSGRRTLPPAPGDG